MGGFTIPNRPFSVHPWTRLMMPDGIFEASLGKQELHAYIKNTSGGSLSGTKIYLEGVSNPGVAIEGTTYDLSDLPPNASRALPWIIDATNAPAGEHFVSFVGIGPAGTTRIIKKIFVTRTTHNPSDGTFSADVPQGRITVEFESLFASATPCCGHRPPSDGEEAGRYVDRLRDGQPSFLDVARQLYTENQVDFVFCPPGYLPKKVRLTLTPAAPYSGQYGPLPFEDPWWKIVLCVVAVALLTAAAIVEGIKGTGSVVISTATDDNSCCGVQGNGGGSDKVAAGLAAAAAAAATAAGLSDQRDAMRRGQDETAPNASELTIAESFEYEFIPHGPVALGRPFEAGIEWTYQRITDSGTSYSHSTSETGSNVHVLTRYEISAPDTYMTYSQLPFIVKGEFFDSNNQKMVGDQLFVQCFLISPSGYTIRFPMFDDGTYPDTAPNDGIYIGGMDSRYVEEQGLWTYFVIAQDVNNAQPEMSPEQAAQIVGGMVVTHQLSIGFSGGTCPLVPDGHVNVIR